MGCGISTGRILADESEGNSNLRSKRSQENDHGTAKFYSQIINEASPRVRLDHSEVMKELPISGDVFNFKINYCYISQRGYYPNSLGKANQDSYVICESILGDPNSHLFGIFDGHGEYGDSCSHFAASNVPAQLVKVLMKHGGVKALDGPQMESLYSEALVNSNKAMHHSKIDDTLSGTTCISVILRGDTLLIANVGDSRAIIASEMEEGLIYSPLSADQTPYRKDERERVKLMGARVLTLGQIEGKEPVHENWGSESGDVADEDPPRVWDSSLERPGCAFTRSLGDSVAEACGVSGEPEIMAWKLSPYNKYVIIASDGVFEFLSSQAVIDIISKFQNVVEGAKYVVAEAYRLWLTYDERTDDISMIVIRIDDMTETVGVQKTEVMIRHQSCILETGSNKTSRESKPVRKAMSHAKRKLVNATPERDDSYHCDFESLVTFKSAAEIKRISTMIETNFMFQHLNALQKDQIFQVMTMRWVTAGETIIKEGDLGDEMYLIDSGTFIVLKRDDNGVSQEVFKYTSNGAAFGELSLMYRQRRAATVRALSDGALWCLGRHAFRAVLMRPRREGLLKVLKMLPVFNALTFPQLERLCTTSHEQTYRNKDVIFGPGSLPDNMEDKKWVVCVIRIGSLKMAQNKTEQSSKVEHRGQGNFLAQLELSSMENGGTEIVIDFDADWDRERDERRENHKDADNESKLEKESRRGSSSDLIMGSSTLPLRVFSSVVSQGITTVAYIPLASFLEIVGHSAEKNLMAAVCVRQQSVQQGSGFLGSHSSMKPRRSIFSMPDRLELTKMVNVRSELTLQHCVLPIGDFAYLGTFKHESGQTYSLKVIAKYKAAQRRMDMRLLDERIFLSALRGFGNCVPKIVSTFQDSRVALLIYEDIFCCDLAAVLSAGAIGKTLKPYYAACILAGIIALHNNGLMHRYVTPEAVYVTAKGVPMLADMRYSKRMDGSRCFTICGDPLYFSPEIIRQQGYDYAVDLWAYGILLYEMYEEEGPFGPDDVEETILFTAVTSHKEGALTFTDKTPKAARDLISLMLHPEAHKRGGYTDMKRVFNLPYFEDIVWDRLGHDDGVPLPTDVHCSIRASTVFEETALEPYSSLLFQQF